jgi:SpoIID/LytB domain protein
MLGRWSDRGFDLLPTVEDQVYGGVEAEKPGCTVAVEETRGEVAVQGGAPIRAFYSSTCGGHTAAADEVWDRPPASYLRAVRDRTGRVDRCSAGSLRSLSGRRAGRARVSRRSCGPRSRACAPVGTRRRPDLSPA